MAVLLERVSRTLNKQLDFSTDTELDFLKKIEKSYYVQLICSQEISYVADSYNSEGFSRAVNALTKSFSGLYDIIIKKMIVKTKIGMEHATQKYKKKLEKEAEQRNTIEALQSLILGIDTGSESLDLLLNKIAEKNPKVDLESLKKLLFGDQGSNKPSTKNFKGIDL